MAIHSSRVPRLSAPEIIPNSVPKPRPPTKVAMNRNTPAARPSRQRLSARSLGRRVYSRTAAHSSSTPAASQMAIAAYSHSP